MGISVADLNWALELDRAFLVRELGSATVARGEAYAERGAVTSLAFRDGGIAAVAVVTGSGGRQYVTSARVRREGRSLPTVEGRCSCPMVADCKHVVAVLLACRERAEERLGHAGPRWESVLRNLVTAPSADGGGAGRAAAELGLGVEVVEPRGHGPHGEPRLRLRPVRAGARGWVKTGVGWRDIEHGYGRAGLDPAQRELMMQILRAHRTHTRGYHGLAYGDQSVHLDQLGPAAWSLLRDLGRQQVPIVRLPDGGDVQLSTEPVALSISAVQDERDRSVRLEPVLRLGDRPLPADGAPQPVGDPAHVVWWHQDGALVLAAMARPLTPGARAWLEVEGALTVPEVDVPRLVATYLPVIGRSFQVVSPDGSLVSPEVRPPVLALDVTFEPDHVVRLAWAFQYRAGESVTRLSLVPTPTDPPRDCVAEQATLASLDVLDAVPGLRVDVGGQRRLVPENVLSGWATATFVSTVLPALRARDDVVVDVSGTELSYREAPETPRIEYDVRDDEVPDWFSLGVTVRVGPSEVPFGPLFAALARGDAELLLSDGRWLRLDRRELHELRALIEQSRDLVDKDTGRLRVTAVQAGLWEQLVQLGVVQRQSERWAAAVGGLLDAGSVAAAQEPAGLLATLRPYQREGFQWLSLLWDLRLGGVLADDMGLGKTLQTLAMVSRAHGRGDLDSPFLVVAPTSVVSTWVSEAARFCPGLDVVAVTETQKRSGTAIDDLSAGHQLVVTSYALLRIDSAAYRRLPWSGLVLDEAQFVKNHRTATYQSARRIDARFTLAITGTPLENSLMDLWSLLSLVAPGLFPDPERFVETYRRPIESGSQPEMLAALRRRIRPLVLRRTKEQVAPELPAKQEQVLSVALNPKHRRAYQTHLQRERQRILGMLDDVQGNRLAILRSLTVLRQVSLDPALVDDRYAGQVRSSKVDALLEHLHEVVAEGHRALVFSQFTGFLRVVRTALDAVGIRYCYLDGRTQDRPRRVAEFRDGDAPVFLISLKAGGFGLTLTEADYVFVLDPWWNPAAEAQAVDRTHRIGQDKSVMVYRMVSEDTIEEKVVALQERKRRLFRQVLDGGEPAAAPLSAEEIRSLLAD